jgi:hypothetical protein
MPRDWVGWHERYDDPSSLLSRRLAIVQGHVRAALDAAPAGPVRAVSLCAGQGRDLIGALDGHPRRLDVTARLVELDPTNAAVAAGAAAAAGLAGVEVVTGDAALTDAYRGAVPAELVLACGVFGNIPDADIERTIRALPQLCATGATVVWTRGRRHPDLVPAVCGWFAERGFEERWLSDPTEPFAVGVHRYRGDPAPLARGLRLFEFADG